MTAEVEREIPTQPELWRRAAGVAASSEAQLPPPGARVAVVGCGTSWFMAQAWACLREAAGSGVTDAFAASEAPVTRAYDAFVAVSRSGTTSEVARLLRAAPDETWATAVTAVAESPVAREADEVILLDFADERSVVQTRFATTALAMLRASLGEDLGPVADDGEDALRRALPEGLAEFGHFVFLGHGWTVGLANEAALKFREAAQAWTESYPAMEYRHGPISVAGPGSLVWSLGDVEEAVLRDVSATGATVVSSALDPMAELVVAQRAAIALAASRGLDPDRPRHLTRSVVLPE
jgi:fructoselysine-6-P-deglycase FrlB-like protein